MHFYHFILDRVEKTAVLSVLMKMRLLLGHERWPVLPAIHEEE